MELWYTENHSENVKFSIKITEHLYHYKSQLFTLDGLIMVTEKDEFIYHDMISHVPMAVNPNIKSVLVIGGGDGGGTVRELTRYEEIEIIDLKLSTII
ncbi:MAG: spermidine synthase [Fusobacteria bacterium]|nr:MAG: spermidine synthase [Fusobacteriota bacterium]KAF0229819.1 MAG: spermidine [Fusobacteriota bacterium]